MLFRFDPFETLDKFDRRPSMLGMDAVRTDEEVIVYFDAPGFGPDDIDLTVEKNSITVEASRRWNDPDVTTLSSERPQGVFRRQIQVGDQLDTDNVSAKLDMGVLTLSIPVMEGTKPRSVKIESSSTQRKLAASSS